MSEKSLRKHEYIFNGFLDSLKTDYVCEGWLPATIHIVFHLFYKCSKTNNLGKYSHSVSQLKIRTPYMGS